MPITAPGSGTALVAAIEAAQAPIRAEALARAPLEPTDLAALRDAMAAAQWDAVLAYLAANAVVVVASVSGVTTGGGVSGPGAGTIT